MNCEHVIHHLDSYVRGETPAGVTAKIAQHLESCATCREDEAIARQVANGLRSMRHGAPAGLADRIIAAAPTPVARKLGWFTPVRALAATLLVVAVIGLTREGRRLITDESYKEMTTPVAAPGAAGQSMTVDKVAVPQTIPAAPHSAEADLAPVSAPSAEPEIRDRPSSPPAAARPSSSPARRSVADEAAGGGIVNAPQEMRAFSPAPATSPASSAPPAPTSFGASGSSAKSAANEDDIPAASSTEGTARYRSSPRSFSIMLDNDSSTVPAFADDSMAESTTSAPSSPDTTTDSPARR